MTPDEALVWMFGVVVAGGVAVVIAGLRHRTKVIELAHRERLAMIEHGITPPERVERPAHPVMIHDKPAPNRRLLSIGVLVIGFGFALAMIVGFAAGATEIAVGIGGAVAIIGAAFVVIALVTPRYRGVPPPAAPGSPVPPSPSRPDLDSHPAE
jgi:Domain of unknown function (DUF6249)